MRIILRLELRDSYEHLHFIRKEIFKIAKIIVDILLFDIENFFFKKGNLV